MLRKKNCVVFSVFTYFILILIIFLSRDKRSFKYVCSTNSGCVRFCCNDHQTCNESFIRKNFNASLVTRVWNSNWKGPQSEIKIMLGKPTCDLELISPDVEWEFHLVNSYTFFLVSRYVIILFFTSARRHFTES